MKRSALGNSRYVSRDHVRPPIAAGIDSLYVSYYLDGLGIDWEELQFQKEKLHSEPGRKFAEIEMGGEPFALHRGGLRPYPFRLTNGAFTLRLGKKNRPKCHVQFASEALWLEGLESLTQRFERWYRKLGEKPVQQEGVTRFDAAFDFYVPEVDFEYDNFVSLADKDARWNENRVTQSYQFGKSDIVWRFYDKVAEIEQQSGKHWLFDLWGRDSKVFRAEVQMRGEFLKDNGIVTLAQLRAHAPQIVKRLATNHTSLRRKTRDKNRSRWPLHPIWEGLLESVDRVSQGPPVPKARRHEQGDYALALQGKSVYGMLKRMAATLSARDPKSPVTLEELLERLPRLLGSHHSDRLWEADVRAIVRQKRFGL